MRTKQRFGIGLVIAILGTGFAQTGAAQQPGQQPLGRPQAENVGVQIQCPWELPLTAQHEKYRDEVLKYWEYRSGEANLTTFRCRFIRWEYDPVFGPPDPNIAKTESSGELQYAAPDKGLFKVNEIRHYTPPREPGAQPTYAVRQGDLGEHWVTDGVSIFQFEHRKQQLIETKLPPEMQGKGIVDGPLPFMFGANAEKLKQRYWIRVITPEQASEEYWLQVAPKFQEDYAQFRTAEIILAEKDFLPKAVQLHHARSRTVFELTERHINERNLLDAINLFKREFHEPALPRGWQKVVENLDAVPADPRQARRE